MKKIKDMGYTDVSQWARVVQVIPCDNYDVIIYYDTGHIFKINCRHLLDSPTMEKFKDIELFKKHCVILNSNVAWYLGDDRYDDWNCYDLDNEIVFKEGKKFLEEVIDKSIAKNMSALSDLAKY